MRGYVPYIGRRGTVLLILGLMWVLIGFYVATGSDEHSPYYMLSHASAFRAVGWWVTGVVAIVAAPMAQGRDRWGFLALYLMAAYRFAAQGAGFVDYLDDAHGGPSDAKSILGCILWGSMLALIVVVSGWRESDDSKDPE